jgi:hypothetical protein
MTQVNTQQVLVSLILLGVGVPAYVLFAPKKDITMLKQEYLSREAILERAYRQGGIFLANVVRHIKWRIYKAKGIDEAWEIDKPKQRKLQAQ